jgi:hypothetical protein
MERFWDLSGDLKGEVSSGIDSLLLFCAGQVTLPEFLHTKDYN